MVRYWTHLRDAHQLLRDLFLKIRLPCFRPELFVALSHRPPQQPLRGFMRASSAFFATRYLKDCLGPVKTNMRSHSGEKTANLRPPYGSPRGSSRTCHRHHRSRRPISCLKHSKHVSNVCKGHLQREIGWPRNCACPRT